MKKVICIGSATKDIFLALNDARIIDNQQDETAKKLLALEFGAKVYANNFHEEVGGGAVNVAAGLANCEIRPFIFARTSKSQTGKWILKQISKKGIKKNYMQQSGGGESEISVIISDKKHFDHVILRTGDSVDNFNLQKALEKFREKVDWIYISSQKENWLENINQVVEFAKEKKAKIALNPSSFQISKDAQVLKNFLDKIEILFINRDEAIKLIKNIESSVEDKPEKLMKKLIEYGMKVVVLTDGENGAYVTDGDNQLYTPIVKSEIIDTTGAGDAFASGFLASFIEENDIQKGLKWGINNSAGVLTGWGATEGLLSKKELSKK